MRNKSLPAFNFEWSLSGFTNVSTPYNKLKSSASTNKNSSALTEKSSPFLRTGRVSVNNHMNPIDSKLSPRHCLRFDTSPSRR